MLAPLPSPQASRVINFTIPLWEVAWLRILVGFSVIISCFGLMGSIYMLVEDWGTYGARAPGRSTVSYPVLSYPIISYHILSYPVVPHRTTSHHITSVLGHVQCARSLQTVVSHHISSHHIIPSLIVL